jgi:L-ascorbate metabolism protein UlaG (beta-lactamase superfamily)
MKTMMSKMLALCLMFLIGIPFCKANDTIKPEANLKVTYIANEGFLIEVDDKSVLIDALFGEEELGFCDVPGLDQIAAMKAAEGLYEEVDLILTSHNHVDHIHAPFVAEHLKNNEHGKFISCTQAVQSIRKAENYSTEIESQLLDITPDSLMYTDTVVNGIDVRVFRLQHGPFYVDDPETGKSVNKHQNVQNLGFLLNINGVKIFHCGDSSPTCMSDYEHFGLGQEEIDIAFLGRGFVVANDVEGVNLLKQYINPKHIVLMHIHQDYNAAFIELAESLKEEYSSIVVFEELMQVKEYAIE